MIQPQQVFKSTLFGRGKYASACSYGHWIINDPLRKPGTLLSSNEVILAWIIHKSTKPFTNHLSSFVMVLYDKIS